MQTSSVTHTRFSANSVHLMWFLTILVLIQTWSVFTGCCGLLAVKICRKALWEPCNRNRLMTSVYPRDLLLALCVCLCVSVCIHSLLCVWLQRYAKNISAVCPPVFLEFIHHQKTAYLLSLSGSLCLFVVSLQHVVIPGHHIQTFCHAHLQMHKVPFGVAG